MSDLYRVLKSQEDNTVLFEQIALNFTQDNIKFVTDNIKTKNDICRVLMVIQAKYPQYEQEFKILMGV